MDKMNEEITSGYNDLQQVQMSIKAAEKMVGTATISMDPDQLQQASNAVADAQAQLAQARANETGVDEQFLKRCEQELQACSHQLTEAKQ
ncbi:DUF2564 family protein [Metabacillus iocasae]|uniref:NADH dehydrogenase/NADH:ubiquinone oxidoreductase subunit G n=1 Tax=Priestia iocasae TaxID=2291674 RepID=A0ABS2QUS3_9BACI|nr:DUF2564 family protein [Metabacillus iocasae]MBM7703245.1 NADH dehydrogenase/NADH:ubiquinone oxidoreductase subunit G [Metabacillus iocasae]